MKCVAEKLEKNVNSIKCVVKNSRKKLNFKKLRANIFE